MKKAYLHLENGVTLTGTHFGYEAETAGEVVFSTGMTGYVQSLTDPSFYGQILTFTYPLMGNYGVPEKIMQDIHLVENMESENIWTKGVIVSTLDTTGGNHHERVQNLSDWLKQHKIPGIFGIDTRSLTQLIREHGVLNGVISFSEKPPKNFAPIKTDKQAVSISQPITYVPKQKNNKHVALVDCGVKHGILRELLSIGYTVTRMPWNVNPLENGEEYDGIIFSNGPGDPKEWTETIMTAQKIIAQNIPILGVCLGHQILSLAVGADTYKLKYGHRGINQPCQDVTTKKCYLTSQNHGYAVNPKTLPQDYSEWFINLNDGTCEGMMRNDGRIRSTQFHPEGNPGPFDSAIIFKEFLS